MPVSDAGAATGATSLSDPTDDEPGRSRSDDLPPSVDPLDRALMARALEMARLAAQRSEVPVGAVLALDGHIVAEAHNRTVTDGDPTAHAEVVVIREGARRLGGWRLLGTTLYVTLEPCAQCAGAIVLARIPRLVYGAPDPKTGMAGSLGNVVQDPRLNHSVELVTGILAEPAGDLLRAFFRERRP